jgi:hypothetical protein
MFRTLEEPVSKVVKDLYPTAVENEDKNLPVVYGTVMTKVIRIESDKDANVYKYVVGENITNVIQVFNKDGVSISFSKSPEMIITTSQEIDSARVTGNTNNRLGNVLVDIIESKTKIKYIDSFWDRTETDAYIANSPRINIQFDGGTVRDAIKKVLSSDIVFLIQKNDGKFTLRKWGNTYQTHIVPNWNVTKFPVKDYAEAQNNYFSSCSIAYNYDFNNNAHNSIYLYTLKERKAMKNYSKVVRREFETYLTNENDCKLLAEQLSNRFTTLHETEKVSIGADTSSVNLLDTVELELKVNERAFSKNNIWIVKEIDPAQDTLSLEAMTI